MNIKKVICRRKVLITLDFVVWENDYIDSTDYDHIANTFVKRFLIKNDGIFDDEGSHPITGTDVFVKPSAEEID